MNRSSSPTNRPETRGPLIVNSALSGLVRRVGTAEFVRGVATISGGTAIAQVVPILLTPLLTRLYSPSDIGLLGLYVAFVSLCANATTLGYSMAIVSGRTDRECAELALIAAVATMPMATLFSAVMFALISFDKLGFGRLPKTTAAVMWLSLLLTGVYFTLRPLLVRNQKFRIVSQATIAQSIGRMGTQIATGLAGFGSSGLILGEVVGRASGLLRLWRASRQPIAGALTGTHREGVWGTAKKYKKFPMMSAPSSLLNSLALVLPVPLITMQYGIYEAGQFSVAYRVLGLPLSLIGASVADVFHARISLLSRERPERGVRFFLTVAGALLPIGILPMILVAFGGEYLFSAILGSNWGLAGLIAAAIAPWVLMEFVVGPLSRVVLVYCGQELKFVYDILVLFSIAGGISFGSLYGWSVVDTCKLLGWTQSVVYAVYFLLLLRIIKKYKMINWSEQKEPANAA